MSSNDFEVGELVWAKMKGYPPWPAKIEEPKADSKPLKQKKSHYVYFFGSNNYAWIQDENISHHSESILLSLTQKKSGAYQSAITDFLDFAKNGPKEHNEDSPPKSPNIEKEKDSQVKVVKVLDSDPKIKQKSVLVKKKKIIRKRSSEDGKSGTFSKYRKFGSDKHPRVGSIPTSSRAIYGGSISPDDEDYNDGLLSKHLSASGKEFGFIGLGHIGRSIVLNLLESGHSVTVWNKTGKKCDPFVPLGAKVAHSPADLIMACDITFCSVSDKEASKELIFADKGILAGLEKADRLGIKDRSYVEMTTIDPDTSQQIAEAVMRKKGRYLEAPIFGDSKDALEGNLLILASGDRRIFKDCETCFHAIGKHAYYIDCKLGFGAKMSLVLSSFSGTMYAAVAEAVVLAQRLNLDMNSFLRILEKGPLQCGSITEKVQKMLKCNFRTITPLKHMQKDVDLSLTMGDNIGQPMPVTAAANEVYKHARLLKYSNCDVSAVYQAARY